MIVEGKYDKITLENIIDATIVTTNGFGIYKDPQKRKLIRLLCEKNGAVIITDSDSAGVQIRSYLKSFCDSEKIVNVYLPQIVGKERRKAAPSKQGFLGLEGMSESIIVEALQKSGVTDVKIERYFAPRGEHTRGTLRVVRVRDEGRTLTVCAFRDEATPLAEEENEVQPAGTFETQGE